MGQPPSKPERPLDVRELASTRLVPMSLYIELFDHAWFLTAGAIPGLDYSTQSAAEGWLELVRLYDDLDDERQRCVDYLATEVWDCCWEDVTAAAIRRGYSYEKVSATVDDPALQRRVHEALTDGRYMPRLCRVGLMGLWDAAWPGLESPTEAMREMMMSETLQTLWLGGCALSSWRYRLVEGYWRYREDRSAPPSDLVAFLSAVQDSGCGPAPGLKLAVVLSLLVTGSLCSERPWLFDIPAEFEDLLTAQGRKALNGQLNSVEWAARKVRSGVLAIQDLTA